MGKAHALQRVGAPDDVTADTPRREPNLCSTITITCGILESVKVITWIQCEAGSCLLVGDPNKETLVELWPRRFHRSASTALRLHGSPRSRVWTLVVRVRHRQRVCACVLRLRYDSGRSAFSGRYTTRTRPPST